MDMVERYAHSVLTSTMNWFRISIVSVLREATRKSKDGRISQSDFLNHTASSTRYSLFTPMEASIIFHFAGRGDNTQRLALIDFAQLLDPRWRAPHEAEETVKPTSKTTSVFHSVAHSIYNFGLGGVAGAFGATIVYPIDLGMSKKRWESQWSLIYAVVFS